MFDPTRILIRLAALLPALVGHEFAHGYSAYRLGDPTPKLDGRLTLNPVAHLDPIGTLMIIFAPIGWAKPVRINPYNFRNPSRDMMISTACGPLSNLAQGTFWALLLRLILAVAPARLAYGNMLVGYLAMLTLINFVLALFNLIPLGPLDGHEILAYFLPYRMEQKYRRFNQYGMGILIGLIMVSFLWNVPILFYLVVWPAIQLGSVLCGVRLYALIGATLA